MFKMLKLFNFGTLYDSFKGRLLLWAIILLLESYENCVQISVSDG